ncbi:hypothetical protein OLZ31_25825 [Enterobacter asburiae]|nr:hypothetical protein [Enterobacter asburiae]
MFSIHDVQPVERYIKNLRDEGVRSPTDFYIRELSLQPGFRTRILYPEVLSEYWETFRLTEQRFIAHLYEQYPVWKYYLLIIRKRSKKTVCVTNLQQAVIDNNWNVDDFFSYLIEDINSLDEISEGLDIIKDFKTYQSADAFEASCYFFILAHKYLCFDDFKLEYHNAICEALEHQGEFKGWAAAMLYKNEAYEKFFKKDKGLGIFKFYAFKFLEEAYINGDKYKTDVEVQGKLNDFLRGVSEEKNTGPVDFSVKIKNWYDAKDSDLKKLIKRLVHR